MTPDFSFTWNIRLILCIIPLNEINRQDFRTNVCVKSDVSSPFRICTRKNITTANCHSASLLLVFLFIFSLFNISTIFVKNNVFNA